MWFHTFGQMKTIQIKTSTIKKILFGASGLILICGLSLILNLIFASKIHYLEKDLKDLENGLKNTNEITKNMLMETSSQNEHQKTDLAQTTPPNTASETTSLTTPDAATELNTQKLAPQTTSNITKETIKVSPIADSPIQISNVEKIVNINEKTITISFHLTHLKEESRPSISGYVIIIGKNEDVSNPIYVTYPTRVKLNKDFPSDYGQGESFLIKNLKIVKASIPLQYDNIAVKDIIIYIFSRPGELLLEKPIPLGEGE